MERQVKYCSITNQLGIESTIVRNLRLTKISTGCVQDTLWTTPSDPTFWIPRIPRASFGEIQWWVIGAPVCGAIAIAWKFNSGIWVYIWLWFIHYIAMYRVYIYIYTHSLYQLCYIIIYIYIYIYVHISSGISALAPALQLSPPLINSANSFKIWASMASFLKGYPAEELKTTTIVQSQLMQWTGNHIGMPCYPCSNRNILFWVNHNNSLTWIKAIWGWFPLLTMISSELVVSSL